MQHPIEKKIPGLPTGPGVYLMKGASGAVLYVGKAKNLKARLRSYVGAQAEDQPKTRVLVPKVKELDVIVTRTEKEALLLENTLIKKYRPRYNVRLTDDKTYLHILLDRNHPFPRFVPVRRPGPPKAGQQVFGPYSSASAVRDTLRQIRKLYPLRTCKDRDFRLRNRPCLQAQMGRCAGACTGEISPDAYREMVDQAVWILQGRSEELLRQQQEKMQEASEQMRFEEAARIRDRIAALRLTVERQRVVDVRDVDRDVIGACRDGALTEIVRLQMRGGNLMESQGIPLTDLVLSTGELLRSFLLQVYSPTGHPPPPEILLFEEPEDREMLEEVLAEFRNGPCSLLVPRRGEKKRLVELAILNARSLLEEHTAEARARRRALEEVRRKTGMEGLPERIECFDISDLQGSFAVGACVVFRHGEPCRQAYRKYKIRVLRGADDYGMMTEVLRRRFRSGQEAEPLPDLLLVDGGKGHLHVAVEALREAGVRGVTVAAIAKARDGRMGGTGIRPGTEGSGQGTALQGGTGFLPRGGTHPDAAGEGPAAGTDRIFVPGRANPLVFSRGGGGRRLLQQVRDEAHRFALTYHRRLRSRDLKRSELDGIPGIGPNRKKSLLRALGDVAKIRCAPARDLAQVPGMDAKAARAVWSHFHPDETPARGPTRAEEVPE
jgi:excinuclease ABC subunit C